MDNEDNIYILSKNAKCQRNKKAIHKGVYEMAVSIATIPVIRGQAAKQMLEKLKTPTITKEFLAECKKSSEGKIIKK